MSNLVCDICKESFTIQLQTEIIDDTEKTFFLCPHCQHEYIAFCINPETERKRIKLDELYSQLKGLGLHAKNTDINRVGNKIKKLRAELKKDMELLNKKFSQPIG